MTLEPSSRAKDNLLRQEDESYWMRPRANPWPCIANIQEALQEGGQFGLGLRFRDQMPTSTH